MEASMRNRSSSAHVDAPSSLSILKHSSVTSISTAQQLGLKYVCVNGTNTNRRLHNAEQSTNPTRKKKTAQNPTQNNKNKNTKIDR